MNSFLSPHLVCVLHFVICMSEAQCYPIGVLVTERMERVGPIVQINVLDGCLLTDSVNTAVCTKRKNMNCECWKTVSWTSEDGFSEQYIMRNCLI
jgi:hypothetical protein